MAASVCLSDVVLEFSTEKESFGARFPGGGTLLISGNTDRYYQRSVKIFNATEEHKRNKINLKNNSNRNDRSIRSDIDKNSERKGCIDLIQTEWNTDSLMNLFLNSGLTRSTLVAKERLNKELKELKRNMEEYLNSSAIDASNSEGEAPQKEESMNKSKSAYKKNIKLDPIQGQSKVLENYGNAMEYNINQKNLLSVKLVKEVQLQLIIVP